MMISTRKDARDAKLTTYFTGKPCKRGHDAPRYVNSGNCVVCNKLSNQSYYKPLEPKTVRIKITIPHKHIRAIKALAAAFCALEKPTP